MNTMHSLVTFITNGHRPMRPDHAHQRTRPLRCSLQRGTSKAAQMSLNVPSSNFEP